MRCGVTGTTPVADYGAEASPRWPARTGPEQIFKTLVIAGPSGLAVAVLPVPWKLSLKAAAAALGLPGGAGRPGGRRTLHGLRAGRHLPLGQRRPLPTVVDASALGFDRVLCSAGKRGWDVALAPENLVALTQAVTADIRAPG